MRLRDLGNTVLVVEHDEEAILTADHVLDIGPGAGVHGGHVVAQGTPAQVRDNPAIVTGDYLSGRKMIALPAQRHVPDRERLIRIEGASANNLHEVDAEFPVGLFTCVTGVSGSGKSTLVNDTLYSGISRHLGLTGFSAPQVKAIEGLDHIDRVIDIDQSPIGRTPRSNPATYTGLFAPLRELFAQVPRRARVVTTLAVSLQREGRSLRSLPGRRRDPRRDAFPAGCVRALRCLPGPTLQPRDAGSALPRQEHP